MGISAASSSSSSWKLSGYSHLVPANYYLLGNSAPFLLSQQTLEWQGMEKCSHYLAVLPSQESLAVSRPPKPISQAMRLNSAAPT